MSKASSILADFPTATTAEGEAQWHSLLAKVLGDKSYGEALCHKAEDGFLIDPAPKPNGYKAAHQKQSGDCLLAAHIDNGSVESANADILTDLAGGAGALHIVLDMFGKRGRGVVINSQDDFSKLLAGIYLDFIPISIDAGQGYTQATEMLMHEYNSQNIDHDKAVAQLNIPVTKNDDGLSHLVSSVQVNLPHVTCIGVDGASCHNAGASAGQELAFMLASGVAALRCLTTGNMGIDAAAKQITFHMAADADVFMGLAKIRAFRHMWGEVLKASGATHHDAVLKVQTSRRMMANVDVETNILRTTAACFAAMLGGADGVSILPYDVNAPSDDTGRKARRVARNIAIILEEEGFLTRTHDVAAGSYSIEVLSEQLATSAWGLFQEIEAEGGIDTALSSGTIATWLKGASANRAKQVDNGDKTIIGINAFHNPEEDGPEEGDAS